MNRNERVNILINAKERTKGVLSAVKGQLLAIGAAYGAFRIGKEVIGESVKAAMDYEATLVSLKAVSEATGRDMNQVYAEMKTHMGGLASEAQVASGFLKGMTTTLNVEQISDMTRAIKDASLAMGEDFGQQLPLIIKAVKQLNPAILDNIGVTVRLDQVNKKIKEGFYGMGKEINEATQQHAIFTEIMKQTSIYAGQEAAILGTNAGKIKKLKAEYENFQLRIGGLFSGILADVLPSISSLVSKLQAGISESYGEIKGHISKVAVWIKNTVGGIWNTVSNMFESFKPAAELVIDNMKEVFSVLGDVINSREFHVGLSAIIGALGVAMTVTQALLSVAIATFKGMIEAGAKAGEALVHTFEDTWELIKAIFSGGANIAFMNLVANASLAMIDIGTIGKTAFDEISLAAQEGAGDIEASMDGMMLGILETFSRFNGQVQEDVIETAETTGQAARTAAESTAEAIAATAEVSQAYNDIIFEASLIGLTDYQAEVERLWQERAEKEQEFRDNKKLNDEQLNEALLALDEVYAQKRQEALDEETEVLTEQWYERWSILTDQLGTFSHDLVQVLITDTNDLRDVMRNTFEQIGQSIAHNLVNRGLKAVWAFVAGQAAQKAATIGLAATQKAASAVTATETIATKAATRAATMLAAAKAAVTSATAGLTAASGAALAAMAAEGIVVRALTRHYIALASAKAAATLGISAGPSIAAAATVKASLTAMLTGFDDPLNDAVAYRHGEDYADHFMAGAQTRFKAPGFGVDVRDSLPIAPGSQGTGASGGDTHINLTIEGNIIGEDSYVLDSLIPAIERAVTGGYSRLSIDDDNLTGRTAVSLG